MKEANKMAMTVHCDIVSAEQEIFSGLIEMVIAAGTEGDIGVAYGHAHCIVRDDLCVGPASPCDGGVYGA